MTSFLAVRPRQSTFPRGIHPDECKALSADRPIEPLPAPRAVRVPLVQHLGAPCEATVAARAEVILGDKVGDAQAFVSAPVHASVSGTVGRPAMVTLPNGRHVPAVTIQAAAEQPLAAEALWEELYGGPWPLDEPGHVDPPRIAAAAREAGLVGMGGAAFPMHVKLTRNEQKPIRWVLLNGCECEPYLTADYRMMVEAPEPIILGGLLAQRAVGAEEVIVCVEDNKLPAAMAVLEAARGTAVKLRVLRTKYPQGGEKQLVLAVLGREVPLGGLPLDIGAVVINVGTAAALARAVLRGKPLTHRVVTVTGRGVREPKNLLVPIGASYGELIDACGGLTDEAARVVAGGPMMGFTLGTLDAPVTKGTSGVTVLGRADVDALRETPCVRCGRCVDVCPMRLVPTKLAVAARAKDADLAARYFAAACVECGCCAFVCPARLPLVQLIRVAKMLAQPKK
jgi:Na+-translocating ferredoxin:NAD+ oxidoreductase subunit C